MTSIQEETNQLAEAKLSNNFPKIVELVKTAKNRIDVLKVMNTLTLEGLHAKEFASAGACECLTDLLKNPGKDAAMTVFLVCSIVGNLCYEEDNRNEFDKLGACSVLVETLCACKVRQDQVAETGMFAMSKLGLNQDRNIVELGKHYACQFVLEETKRFWDKHEALAGSACAAMVVLARSDANREEFQSGGAVPLVLHMMEKYAAGNDQIAYLGFSALANLVSATDGSVLVVPEIQILSSCVLATENMAVFEKACVALANMALNPENQLALGDHLVNGLCDKWTLFLSEMSPRLAGYACMLVANLAFNNPENQHKLANCTTLVVQALRAFGQTEDTVARNGCLAIGNLAAKNPENLLRMENSEEDICVQLLNALRSFGSQSTSVSKNACFAITTLAYNSSVCKSKFKLVSDAEDVIKSAIENQYQPYALHDVTKT